MSDTYTKDLGAVTAYADAKAHGYTGTREEFGQLLANAGINLQAAKEAKESAENSANAAAKSEAAAKDSAVKAAFDAAANVDSTFLSLYTPDTMETFTGNPITCHPGKGSPLAVTVQGKTTQAGEGKASPDNIRALSGLGESGTLTLTAEGGETRTVEIPLTGPLFTGDMVALAADGSVTETHQGAVKLTVDGSENWIKWTNPGDTADITVPGTISSLADIVCSHYSPLAGTLSSDAGLYTVSTNTTAEPGKTRIILRHGFKTLALFKEYLKAQADAGTPVTFVYKLTPATETPTVTKRTAEPLCAVPDADGLCTVQGGGTLTVTGYEDPRATRRALEKRIAALEAKA